jgi:hypothetical protein
MRIDTGEDEMRAHPTDPGRDRTWRMVAVDLGLIAAMIAWILGAWLAHRAPGAGTHSPAPSARAAPRLGPYLAYDPIGPHGILDCGFDLAPLLRSLGEVRREVAGGTNRNSYDALISRTEPVFSRSNFGALDVPCAVRVATPAAAAWDAYGRASHEWSACVRVRCSGTWLDRSLGKEWTTAGRELERALRALEGLERRGVSLHRAR